MVKQSTIFVCSECDIKVPRWQGKCPNCGEWNTLEKSQTSNFKSQAGKSASPVNLSSLDIEKRGRMETGISEFDEVVGGGIVPGSLVLLGGDPGIGKSTLALQLCFGATENVLYVSGEESAGQIKLRADRIQRNSNLNVLAENNLETILEFIESTKPELVIVDSIQTMYSEQASGVAGGVSQVTFAVQQIMRLAKQKHVSFIVIGHVTKEGYLAGPKTLEHMVDTVLYLEGERFASFRILRCVKNRFGTTNEVGVFEMEGGGLVEVKNPSKLFLSEEQMEASGNVITAVMEGSRALLVEIQALTSPSNFGYPKRTASGFDSNRLQLIIAILSKRAGLNLSNHDVYINVAGGMKIQEPAADLAVALAIVSSMKEIVIKNTVIVGELGLSGEVRYVSNIEKRVKEAEKLGFENILIPKNSTKHGSVSNNKIKVVQSRSLTEAVGLVS